MKSSPDQTRRRVEGMLDSFGAGRDVDAVVDREAAEKIDKARRHRAEEFDPVDEALVLADMLIAEQWPDLDAAIRLHKLGPDPGDTMDFDRYPAQVALLMDNSRRIVVRKCSQVGVTECLLVTAIRWATAGWRVLYSFPTEGLRDDMVKDRVDRVLIYSPAYARAVKSAVGGSEDMGLKHLGRGSIRFVASKSDVAFIAFPADMIIIDEEDKSDAKNVAMAPDRLQASDMKYERHVGHPTHSDRGIDARYLKSDQKQWHVKCDDCGEEQSLDFFVNVVRETSPGEHALIDEEWTPLSGRDVRTYCRSCRRPVDRSSPGRWVATNPGGTSSGYHFTQLFSPTVRVSELWDAFVEARGDLTKMQLFFNSRLGLPWKPTGQSLSRADLTERCRQDYLMPSSGEACTMGVDVGGKLHVRISDRPKFNVRRAAYIGVVDSFEEISLLIDRFDVTVCVIDSRPETRKAQELQDHHPRVVWLCDYATQPKLDFWKLDHERRVVVADRTSSIDESVARIFRGENWLPSNFDLLDEGQYVEQMIVSVRVRDDSGPRPRFVWDEGKKKDHHFHADNYDNLADKIRQEIGAELPRLTVVTV